MIVNAHERPVRAVLRSQQKLGPYNDLACVEHRGLSNGLKIVKPTTSCVIRVEGTAVLRTPRRTHRCGLVSISSSLVVWRRLHAIDATRVHLTMKWVVSFLLKGRSDDLARNALNIENETTHFIVRWRRVRSPKKGPGTPSQTVIFRRSRRPSLEL